MPTNVGAHYILQFILGKEVTAIIKKIHYEGDTFITEFLWKIGINYVGVKPYWGREEVMI